MIKHIVLFKFLPGTTDAQIDTLAHELEQLPTKIPGIVDYLWGPSVSIEHLEKGYSHGFIMTFTDAGARDAYVPHPIHRELIATYIDPLCEDGLVFDIETPDGK